VGNLPQLVLSLSKLLVLSSVEAWLMLNFFLRITSLGISATFNAKDSNKISFVFDSFIFLPSKTETTNEYCYHSNNEKQGFALLIIGIR
jgi:hypothetical protein